MGGSPRCGQEVDLECGRSITINKMEVEHNQHESPSFGAIIQRPHKKVCHNKEKDNMQDAHCNILKLFH